MLWSISTANCIADDTCAASALWFWPVALLYCLAYAMYFLWSTPGKDEEEQQPEQQPEEEILPSGSLKEWLFAVKARLGRSRTVVALKGGGFAVVMFFYQVRRAVLL